MGIEWCRVLRIIIVAEILFMRLYRSAKAERDEVRIAPILAQETATMVRQGVKPASVLLTLIVGTPMVRTHRYGVWQAPQARR